MIAMISITTTMKTTIPAAAQRERTLANKTTSEIEPKIRVTNPRTVRILYVRRRRKYRAATSGVAAAWLFLLIV